MVTTQIHTARNPIDRSSAPPRWATSGPPPRGRTAPRRRAPRPRSGAQTGGRPWRRRRQLRRGRRQSSPASHGGMQSAMLCRTCTRWAAMCWRASCRTMGRCNMGAGFTVARAAAQSTSRLLPCTDELQRATSSGVPASASLPPPALRPGFCRKSRFASVSVRRGNKCRHSKAMCPHRIRSLSSPLLLQRASHPLVLHGTEWPAPS